MERMFAICLPLEIPLRGCPFQMKSCELRAIIFVLFLGILYFRIISFEKEMFTYNFWEIPYGPENSTPYT